METVPTACDVDKCEDHFHWTTRISADSMSQQSTIEQTNDNPQDVKPISRVNTREDKVQAGNGESKCVDANDRGLRRVIQNFTPSYVILPHIYR